MRKFFVACDKRVTGVLILIDAAGFGCLALFILYMVVTA